MGIGLAKPPGKRQERVSVFVYLSVSSKWIINECRWRGQLSVPLTLQQSRKRGFVHPAKDLEVTSRMLPACMQFDFGATDPTTIQVDSVVL
jgi:hypothetical protein